MIAERYWCIFCMLMYVSVRHSILLRGSGIPFRNSHSLKNTYWIITDYSTTVSRYRRVSYLSFSCDTSAHTEFNSCAALHFFLSKRPLGCVTHNSMIKTCFQ